MLCCRCAVCNERLLEGAFSRCVPGRDDARFEGGVDWETRSTRSTQSAAEYQGQGHSGVGGWNRVKNILFV